MLAVRALLLQRGWVYVVSSSGLAKRPAKGDVAAAHAE
jgi:hypothetical protein